MNAFEVVLAVASALVEAVAALLVAASEVLEDYVKQPVATVHHAIRPVVHVTHAVAAPAIAATGAVAAAPVVVGGGGLGGLGGLGLGGGGLGGLGGVGLGGGLLGLGVQHVDDNDWDDEHEGEAHSYGDHDGRLRGIGFGVGFKIPILNLGVQFTKKVKKLH
ncbi:GGY protein, putative [Ixodes scapularis]|uniref:GGY protein, putative n=1 Tax=Ixodes scapularis TaxID=6945 RepID=B7PGH6_IXOSC|nr:GGY protein, putative [Ixodes scapularis]|eukprot:XP_002434298.1 GGY protein, putative [Ixodes scapularis]